MNVGHSAAVRSIAWVRHRNSPPVPETLSHWITTFNSEEWGPRLRYINGSMEPFYQGPLEILRDDGTEDLVGIVFTNAAFIRNMQPHLRSIRAICMDGTFQTTPREPADLNQLFTIQIILNNVVRFLNTI
uniref:Uncharacterized protein n=1 Tax=Schizaphis graminum TaxID=13262 RepID=A0A2S2NWG0_SCHGA